MKSLYLILAVFLVVACGPRDDEKFLGGDGNQGGFDLKSGEIVERKNEGDKLPTCDQSDDPTWDTVRLFNEVSFIFDDLDKLQVVVGKGSRNCVKISNQDSIEIEVQNDPQAKGFDGTGVRYFVIALHLMNTADLLNQQESLEKVAKGMAMSVEQLKEFLNSEPRRDQITLTYLKPTTGTEPPKEVSSSLKFATKKGEVASDCKDLRWTSIRVSQEIFKNLLGNSNGGPKLACHHQ